MDWWHVIILSLIEGLTEFLPISSTGHLILTSAFLGIHESPAVQQFNIVVQFGAISAVLVLYWKRFLPNLGSRPIGFFQLCLVLPLVIMSALVRIGRPGSEFYLLSGKDPQFPFLKIEKKALDETIDFYVKIILGFLPAALLGLLLKSRIESLLGNVFVVAVALILGGLFLIYSDSVWNNKDSRTSKTIVSLQTLQTKDALWIGCLQCIAFIPGVSRAAATILAGRWRGLSQKEAAEFSFFLAVPTLTGAAFLKLFKGWGQLDLSHGRELAVGTILSFVFAWIAIRFFIALVSKYGFKHFGYYRIVLGAVVLFYFF